MCKEAQVASDERFTASTTIAAPAATIFALLADPGRHQEIDGANHLRGTQDGPVTGTGDTFAMEMYQDAFGPYRMINTVSAFEQDRRIGWSPSIDPDCELAGKLGDMKVGGHTYTYDLAEGDGGTTVTQTYDWSGVTDPQFKTMVPIVTQQNLVDTLANLKQAVE
jgi:hypothetical protein